jgi:C4-dicarboxylate transporter, DctM subunit
MVTVVMGGLMVGLLLLGFPMMMPLLVAALAGLLLAEPPVPPAVLVQQMIGGVTPAALVAVPMFVLAADIMTRGQTADRLLALVTSFVRHRRGGLPISTAVACAMFGSVSGSTQATVVAIGGALRPRLLRAGYPDSFATALIVNASDLALLIPPSIGMIVYGVVTGTSIGELFIAGIGPALVMLTLLCGYCLVASIRFRVAPEVRATAAERWDAIGRAVLPGGFPVLVIGGIYGGWFSPTEAAAMSVLYALVLEVAVFRELSLADLPEIARSTGRVTAIVFVLVAAGAAFSWVISFERIPAWLLGDVLALDAAAGPIPILVVMSIAYFIGCMFVDPIVVILILAPIFHPLAVSAGVDPVHAGVVVTMQVAIGSATPPFGCDLFTAIAVFRRPYLDVVRGTPPFVVLLLVAAAVVIVVPELSLSLRDLAFADR